MFIDSNNNSTHRSIITSQNHGYALLDNSENIPSEWEVLFRNVNDNSNEGICHKRNLILVSNFTQKLVAVPKMLTFYSIYLAI